MLSRLRAALAAILSRRRPSGARGGGRRFAGTRGTGERGETFAAAFLRRNGFRIRERNFRTPVGELDIVAEEAGVLCFVEVKWRRGSAAGHPGEAVNAEKQRRIARAAEWYLLRHRLRDRACRFDVVAIVAGEGEAPSATLVRDAFRGPFRARRRR